MLIIAAQERGVDPGSAGHWGAAVCDASSESGYLPQS